MKKKKSYSFNISNIQTKEKQKIFIFQYILNQPFIKIEFNVILNAENNLWYIEYVQIQIVL